MFYDLNLPIDDIDPLVHRERLAMSVKLGYDAIATNHVVEGRLTSRDICRNVYVEPAVFLKADPIAANAARRISEGMMATTSKSDSGGGDGSSSRFKQLTRLTVRLEDSSKAPEMNAATEVLESYDLVAVQPLNERTFQQACTLLSADIITFDLGQKLQFKLKPPLVKAALQRGMAFEITYSLALKSLHLRRQLFSQAGMVAEVVGRFARSSGGGGAGLVISSAAARAMDLRGPYDVANLAAVFKLDLATAKRAVSGCCGQVVAHGAARRKYKGLVGLETNADVAGDVGAAWLREEDADMEDGGPDGMQT